jgi:hypothetical protein
MLLAVGAFHGAAAMSLKMSNAGSLVSLALAVSTAVMGIFSMPPVLTAIGKSIR